MLEPYKRIAKSPFYLKIAPIGSLIAVLDLKLEGRGLRLILPRSRAIRVGEIHEIVVTDEEASPGEEVNKVCYIGFWEVLGGGILEVGDELWIDGKKIGVLLGFDETHFPNHMNLVFRGELLTGKERGLSLGVRVSFKGGRMEHEGKAV
ncbi:MAG: hypothetical protein NZ900_05380 [Synergistetes bacterium]|nr:hypothetical protein [Synergistota bacterium]MDW8192351.1 hypothetical protein [Synergistota bacterium]